MARKCPSPNGDNGTATVPFPDLPSAIPLEEGSYDRNIPAHVIRFAQIKASIWKNRDDQGSVRYAVTFCRLYRNGEEWGTSYSYGVRDLPLLEKAADAAFRWIAEQIATET